MKRKLLLSALAMGFLATPSCEDLLSSEEKGEKAAAEICDCIKKNSVSKCEGELNSKYSSYTNDEKFIKAFNNSNECDITISKK